MRCRLLTVIVTAIGAVALGSCTSAQRRADADADCDGLSPAQLVMSQPGAVPLVITSTHAGDAVPRSCSGASLKARACEPELDEVCTSGPCRAGGADRGARLITFALVEELEHCLGGRPHLVLSEVERSVVDVNRDAHDTGGGARCALEDQGALPAWEAFHFEVERAVAAAAAQGERPLLVDVHTYNSLPAAPSPAIMIGAGAPFGLTLPRLVVDDPRLDAIFGRAGLRALLLDGARSIDRDARVEPASSSAPLDGLYRGRYVVHRYSRALDDETRARGPAVDAIQLEVSAGLRDDGAAAARAIARALCGAFGARVAQQTGPDA